MQMAQILPGQTDRGADVPLFNVHMERVQHHLDIWAVDRPDKFQTLLAGIEHIALKPVQDLHAERHAAVLRNHGQPLHIPGLPAPDRLPYRPAASDRAAQ